MLFLKSQRGFSLIEVLIGMVILSILVGGVLSVTVGPDLRLFADKVVGNSSCRAEAHRIMSNFKNKGLVRSHYYFDDPADYSAGAPGALPAPGTNVRPVAAELAANEEGVDFVQRWADPVYTITDPTVSPPLIRPYKLTMGVITAIETIYNNNNATVCASATGLAASSAVAPLTALLSPPTNTSGLTNPEAFLKIRAYSDDGTPVACGANITTRPPRGTNITTNQVAAGLNSAATANNNYPTLNPPPVALQDPNVRADISWEVNITVSHTNRSGIVEECSVAERFQYPSIGPTRALQVFDNTGATIDGIGPANSSTLPLTFNTPVGGPNLSCNSPVAPAIRIRLNHARPGSIFMCRNLSAQRPTNGMTIAAPESSMTNTTNKRQTFYSYELSRLNAPGNWVSFLNDPADANTGDLFYTGFYYPQGTYYCNTADGCPGLPHFPRGADDAAGVVGTSYPNYFLSPLAGAERFYIPSNHNAQNITPYNAATNTGTWIPCEYAQISCATSNTDPTLRFYPPTMSEFVPGGGATPDSYRLEYDPGGAGLPSGCEFHMQIAEVDSAYNVRATEVREYTLEKAPGNKLCSTGTTGAGGYPPNRWYFSCDATPAAAPTTLGSTSLPDCVTVTNRNTTVPGSAAVVGAGTACCIDFPGDPALLTSPGAGTWGADPNNTQMIDP